MYYRQEGPGCGGCLMIAALLVLVTGGAPALLNFFGVLFFSGLTGLLLLGALFFGFSYYLRKKVTSYEQSQSESHNQFVWLLVQILIRIAAIDGHISREEVQTIHNFFQYHLRYNQTQMLWVKDLIKAATASTTPLETLLQEFKSTFTYQPRLILVELIYQLLHTKQPVSHEDLQVARNVAHFLEISEYELRAIEAKYQYRQQQQSTASDNRTSQSLAVLGLEAGASEDEIKRAYRALSMQYHPDKVQHLGQEFQQVAEEKMKEINAAYDYLKKTLRVKS